MRKRASQGSWYERELHKEVGVKGSFTRKLVRKRASQGSWCERELHKDWTGHVERMEGVRLTKRADALGVESRRRRGRPRLRWEDCVKRELVGLGGEWGTRARERGNGED